MFDIYFFSFAPACTHLHPPFSYRAILSFREGLAKQNGHHDGGRFCLLFVCLESTKLGKFDSSRLSADAESSAHIGIIARSSNPTLERKARALAQTHRDHARRRKCRRVSSSAGRVKKAHEVIPFRVLYYVYLSFFNNIR